MYLFIDEKCVGWEKDFHVDVWKQIMWTGTDGFTGLTREDLPFPHDCAKGFPTEINPNNAPHPLQYIYANIRII